MRNGNYGLSVVVNGQLLDERSHNNKNYIAAPWDEDFELRLSFPSFTRYECVLSVDGLDVITGKNASKKARGYIVSGYMPVSIPGFRLNDTEVAKFHFGARQDSYAAKLGKGKNAGVIAGVFYAEKTVAPIRISASAAPRSLNSKGGRIGLRAQSVNGGAGGQGSTGGGGAGNAGSNLLGGSVTSYSNQNTAMFFNLNADAGAYETNSLGHDMGTEFGQKENHAVTYVDFERGVQVAEFVLEYASYDALVKAGVIVPRKGPNPFPGDLVKTGPGCTPPQGWTGA